MEGWYKRLANHPQWLLGRTSHEVRDWNDKRQLLAPIVEELFIAADFLMVQPAEMVFRNFVRLVILSCLEIDNG